MDNVYGCCVSVLCEKRKSGQTVFLLKDTESDLLDSFEAARELKISSLPARCLGRLSYVCERCCVCLGLGSLGVVIVCDIGLHGGFICV